MKQKLWYSKLKRLLRISGDKISDSEKSEAEEKIKALKDAIEKKDVEDINKKREELQEVTYKLAAKVYEQANKENAEASENKQEEPKNDDVKEADFEEK